MTQMTQCLSLKALHRDRRGEILFHRVEKLESKWHFPIPVRAVSSLEDEFIDRAASRTAAISDTRNSLKVLSRFTQHGVRCCTRVKCRVRARVRDKSSLHYRDRSTFDLYKCALSQSIRHVQPDMLDVSEFENYVYRKLLENALSF